MSLILQCIREPVPGSKWQWLFKQRWPAYHDWFLKQGDHRRPKYLTCERQLRRYMPELMSTYERLVELSGGSDQAARFLSLYCPTPYFSGCSQTVWTRGEPQLIRNYDYNPLLWDAILLHSSWNGRRVIAMADCLWGALDGINESGLAVSLAFGGKRIVAEDFGMPLILRYILETCETAKQAQHVLTRVPSHMAYNVTVLDAQGAHVTVMISPGSEPMISRSQLATNHQEQVEWQEHARATATLDRAHFLSLRLQDAEETSERFQSRFQMPPLYQTKFAEGWGTLYTAIYTPRNNSATFRWPGYEYATSIDEFPETALSISCI